MVTGWGLMAPVGLFAGISLGLIILLHMRRQIPDRRRVPSIRFWTESRHEDLERSRLRKPPISWILILQLLTALAITLALARPVTNGFLSMFASRTTPEHQIIILDGSTSMQAVADVGSSTSRFSLARRDVVDTLNAWQPGDITTVLIAGSRIETFSASNQQQARSLAARIAKVAPPGGRADMNSTLRLAGDLLLPQRPNSITLITDGAINIDPVIARAIEAPINVKLVGAIESTTNDAIVAISSRADLNQRDQIRVAFTISHFGDQAATIPYAANVDGKEVASGSVTLGPDESRQVEFSVPSDTGGIVVSIPQQDILQADNSASLQLQRDELNQLNIMLIADTPGDVQRALNVVPGSHVEVYPGSTSGLKALATGYDLAVFVGISPTAEDVPAIPMIFFQPQPLNGTFGVSGALASPTINHVESGADLLNGVDLAGVTFTDAPVYDLPADASELVGALSTDGRQGPLIWQGSLDGQAYVATAFTPEASNIGDRVAFPIFVAKAVASLTTDQIPGALALGDPLTYRPSPGTARLDITAPNGTTDDVSVGAASTSASAVDQDITYLQTGIAGTYTLSEIAADGSTTRQGSFVVNAGQRQESNLRPNPALASTLTPGAPSPDDSGSPTESRSDLWPILLALAIMVLLAEWLFALRGRARRRTGRTWARDASSPNVRSVGEVLQ